MFSLGSWVLLSLPPPEVWGLAGQHGGLGPRGWDQQEDRGWET